MLRLGISGGLGSGKSYARNFFSAMGFPTADADELAKKCLQKNEELKNNIRFQFGPETYDNGVLNRQVLAERAFSCQVNQQALNDLVHPTVADEIRRFFDTAENNSHKLAVVEASMLFEAGHADIYNRILLITAEQNIRIERALERGRLNREQILSRMAMQMPEKKKAALSQYVIHNNGTLTEFDAALKQFLEILKF